MTDLIEMARGAGEILREGFGGQILVEHKGDIDLVTEMDRHSEAYLMDVLQRRFPGHKVETEESSGLAGSDGQVWYVDPLDGTVNYAHGIPIFCVSIAYAQGNDLVLGVVYDPMLDECFYAERGKGAWLDGRPLGVSSAPELKSSLLVTGFYYDTWTNPDNNLNHFSNLMLKTQGVRRLGSAAIDLCYVAAGRFDGYWELRLNSWDLGAGALIVQEAGGIVTDINGNSSFFRKPFSIVAANPHIHPQMLEVINKP
ncbi:MAG: inositol monophosphatase [Anaerolineales bacterium]|nr:inositol monophosphatase [Chloroflexota bacterium]MBL6982091.1 inositol monophosphatase [Anaerolineales bacterium]